MTRVDRKALTAAVTERITQRTNDALSRLDIGGIVRGLSAGADKDDQGGVYVILGITFGGRVFGYAGAEQGKGTKYLTRATVVDDRKPMGFALDYPTAAINADKSAEQFRGHNIVRGRLIAGELRAPD
jgi:hypothetical protein